MDANPVALEPISPGSVVDVAYRRIRTLIEDGELGPSTRLRQGDLADALAISRTSVREALHRLTADELVEFKANRGFFVASFRLDAVLERLELRRILEPGFVRLATERATEDDLRVLEEIVAAQFTASTSRVAHDTSREFHIQLARTTRNEQFVRVLEGLWSLDIGRQLLARRSTKPGWQEEDANEHEEILSAVLARQADRAGQLMDRHIALTQEHWSKEANADGLFDGEGA
ncbi:MAG TPA: GntR family transcriptional regulator [Gaiella sp.]|jgi:DNA-binding GntR family transcriptional regulator|nr:GntR family transcriptional regulator [Gaiella sp.]